MNRASTVSIAILLYCVQVSRAQEGLSPNSLEPSAWRNYFLSSRIEALKKQFAAGDRNTERFWQEVSKEGTPLIEPSNESTKHQLVTFLWRGSVDTKNVLVELYPYTWERANDYVMGRMGDTDVWLLTLRLPRGARFAYRLSPDDPLENPTFGVLRNTKFQADPLNPHRWLCAATSSAERCYSRVELPGAVPQPWIVRNPDTSSGKVETHRFRSELLKNERSIAVYTPAQYRARGTKYPLVVLFDGDAYRNLIPTPIILDNLIAARRIPPVVAVFVSNVAAAREAELLFNRTFVDCLASELVPWLRARYSVSGDPRKTVVGGASAGGAAATYAALLYPNLFGNVLAQSAAFNSSPDRLMDWQERTPANNVSDRHVQEEVEDRAVVEGEWLAKQYIAKPKLPLKFYMDAGVFEVSLGGVVGILDGTRHMRDVLLAKGYEVHYQMFVGGHDYLSWRGTLADGLIALIGIK